MLCLFLLSMIGRLALIVVLLVAACPGVHYVTEVLRLIVKGWVICDRL